LLLLLLEGSLVGMVYLLRERLLLLLILLLLVGILLLEEQLLLLLLLRGLLRKRLVRGERIFRERQLVMGLVLGGHFATGR